MRKRLLYGGLILWSFGPVKAQGNGAVSHGLETADHADSTDNVGSHGWARIDTEGDGNTKKAGSAVAAAPSRAVQALRLLFAII